MPSVRMPPSVMHSHTPCHQHLCPVPHADPLELGSSCQKRRSSGPAPSRRCLKRGMMQAPGWMEKCWSASSLSLSPCKHLKHPPAMEQNPTSLLAVSRQGKQKSRRGAGSQDGTWGSLSFSSPSEHFGVSSLFLLSHLLSSNDSCFDPRIEHNFCLTLEGTVWAFEIHCTSTSWCKMPFTL